MNPISQIYSDHKIMPNLQKHQLRVASVAKIICDNFKEPIDKEGVIVACLLHDMGNIIKSDLAYFPDFTKPEGIEYWQKVKDEFIQKYGPDEHVASEAIARELGIPEKALSYIQNQKFSELKKIANKNDSYELKICKYADMRVGPYGVVSIKDRLMDGRERYKHRTDLMADGNFESFVEAIQNIEQQLFLKMDIKPEDINDEKIRSVVKGLRNYMVK